MDPEWRGFRRAPDGVLLFYGFAVFGHILLRVTVQDFPCFADGEPADRIGATLWSAAYVRKGAVVEWFGHGFCLAFGRVRQA